MGYSKLHSSIINSSLWIAPDATRLLFITLLALCDADGAVYGSKYGLSRLANINCNDIDEAWNDLMSHDPDSSDRMRAPEHNGRRVEEISGGYRLLNFAYYRGLRNDDDRREQNRQAQERFRSKSSKPASAAISPDQPASAAESRRQPLKAQAEAEEEAEEEGQKIVPTALVVRDDAYHAPGCSFEGLKAEYHARCPSLPRVRVDTAMRQKHCRSRWLQVCVAEKWETEAAMNWFCWFFEEVEKSDFLTGRSGNKDRPWKADFQWLMTAGNFAKVVEGKYENQRRTA